MENSSQWPVQWEAALSTRWRLTHHTNTYNLFTLQPLPFTYALTLDMDAFFPAVAAFHFSPFPSLLPSSLFPYRCQSCPELSLPSNPSILHLPSPDCQPRTVQEKERNKKSQLWGFFSPFFSSSLIISHRFISGLWQHAPHWCLSSPFSEFLYCKGIT